MSRRDRAAVGGGHAVGVQAPRPVAPRYSTGYSTSYSTAGVMESCPPTVRPDQKGGSPCTTTRPPRRSIGGGQVVMQCSPQKSSQKVGGQSTVEIRVSEQRRDGGVEKEMGWGTEDVVVVGSGGSGGGW
jgi:hypothetical protein